VKSPRLTPSGPHLHITTPARFRPRPDRLTGGEAISEAARLTDRDHQVITLLADHRVLTADQLARLVFGNLKIAQRRLLCLTKRGMLARFRRYRWPGSAPWLYTLGQHGAAIHAATLGTRIPRPAETVERVLRLYHSPRLDHLLGIGEFFATLAGEARHHPEHGQRLVTWWPETVAAAATGAIVRPDAYGEWAETTRTVGFFLELDRGTEKLETLLRKLGQYTELAHAGVTGRAVLFHLPTPGRETTLHRALARRYGRGGPPLPVATTHPGHYATSTPPGALSGPVWALLGRQQRQRLINLAGGPNRSQGNR
jgi:hypothetical protein